MRSLLPLLLVLGCVSTAPDRDSGHLYRRDMKLKVDGEKVSGGVYVLDSAPTYDIKAYLYKRAVVVKATTCHREMVWQEPGKDIEFTFEPIPGLETGGYCPLELGGFDLKGQHAWAFVDFKDGETLPATLSCNGAVSYPEGVSVCQSKVGLTQVIEFEAEVKGSGIDGCKISTLDNVRWEFEMEQGKCLYAFMDEAGAIHRLTTIGYDEVMIR